MPYYLCPRCGSKKHYMGTEIVSGKGGAIMESPVEGMYTSHKAPDRKVNVPKCKECDTILDDKDLRKTPEEKAAERKEKAAERKRIAEENEYNRIARELGAEKGVAGCFGWLLSLGCISWMSWILLTYNINNNEYRNMKYSEERYEENILEESNGDALEASRLRTIASQGYKENMPYPLALMSYNRMEARRRAWIAAGKPSRIEGILFGDTFEDQPDLLENTEGPIYENFLTDPPKKRSMLARWSVPLLSVIPIFFFIRSIIYSNHRAIARDKARKRLSKATTTNKDRANKSPKKSAKELREGMTFEEQLAAIKKKREAKEAARKSPKKKQTKKTNTPKLGHCPDCEKEISKRAPSCPHCGCPDPFG